MMTEQYQTQKKQNSIITLLAWGLYECASSSFATIIQTFVFAVYFIQKIAPNEVEGNVLWGITLGVSGLCIGIASPILGAIADQGGHRKAWLAAFTILCIVCTALLWFIEPSSDYILEAIVLVSLGIIGSEISSVFYNAMLPDLAPEGKIGLWSGLGWSFGYLGGIICLSLALFIFGVKDFWSNAEIASSEPIRATFLLAAIWYSIFSIPLFLLTPDTKGKNKPYKIAIRDGLMQLKNSFGEIAKCTYTFRFLIGRMIYNDGLTSLFAFGGIFAAEVYHLAHQDVLFFAIGINITAGIGALLFSWLDDRVGSKTVILISLVCLIVLSSIILMINSLILFWIFGLSLGIFVGPLQASSRSFMAKVTPPALRNEMFGFFAFSGKATAFLGPIFISGVTMLTGSLYAAISTIIVFFIVGLLIMFSIPSEDAFPAIEKI